MDTVSWDCRGRACNARRVDIAFSPSAHFVIKRQQSYYVSSTLFQLLLPQGLKTGLRFS